MKLKRIFALLGAVLLAGLFILAIVLAVMGAPKNYLMAVIFSLVFIPIVMYAMGLMTRVLKPSAPPEGMDEDGYKRFAINAVKTLLSNTAERARSKNR